MPADLEKDQGPDQKIDQEVDIAIIGAGLVGSLLALFLTRRGYEVDVFERRTDMRKAEISAGRSINLNISCRGLSALERVGVLDDVKPELVPMLGRMMHSKEAELTYQPYGKDDTEYGNSVSRAGLNVILMNKAYATGSARFHFDLRSEDVDFNNNIITFSVGHSGKKKKVKAGKIFGTDGASSAIRRAMSRLPGFTCTIEKLDYGYKELLIPAGKDASFQIEKSALHIWPRGSFMLIALPNFDASFTCTLFLPYEGEKSFEKLTDEPSVLAFFKSEFPDALKLIPNLVESFFENPIGHMETIKAFPWNVGGDSLLMGDAAHGVVPFFGQGMNCGFEDLSVFDRLLDDLLVKEKELKVDATDSSVWDELFCDFVQERKTNCDSIADMAVENFIEMRDRVADPAFLLTKKVEKILEKKFAGDYISRYSLVTFTNVPYKLARDAGIVCDQMLAELCQGLTDPEKVDLDRAKKLIDEKLSPLLRAETSLACGT